MRFLGFLQSFVLGRFARLIFVFLKVGVGSRLESYPPWKTHLDAKGTTHLSGCFEFLGLSPPTAHPTTPGTRAQRWGGPLHLCTENLARLRVAAEGGGLQIFSTKNLRFWSKFSTFRIFSGSLVPALCTLGHVSGEAGLGSRSANQDPSFLVVAISQFKSIFACF